MAQQWHDWISHVDSCSTPPLNWDTVTLDIGRGPGANSAVGSPGEVSG